MQVSCEKFSQRQGKYTTSWCCPKVQPFGKARKRIETIFSQFTDQFNIMRNYAKDWLGFFTRIISKVSALTVAQYINKINNRPIGRIKYALA